MARQIDIILVEQWRECPSWPGYFVSNYGRVKGPRGFRKAYIGRAGYLAIPKNRTGTFLVHRLVAEAFLGPSKPGVQVHHRNNVKTDNRITNLEYVSPSRNAMYKHGHGTMPLGERNGNAKLSSDAIIEIRHLRKQGATPAELSRRYSVSRTQINNILSASHWRHI